VVPAVLIPALYAVALEAGVRSTLVTHGVYLVLLVLAAGAVVARAACIATDRLAWVALAAGTTLYAAGLAVPVVLDLRGQSLPAVGLSDALWLAAYPFTLVGFALLARTRLQRPPLRLALDGLLVVFVLSALASAAVLPAVGGTQHSALELAVDVAYPVLDGLLVALAATVASLIGWRGIRVWALLTAGTVALVAGDVVWAFRHASGTFEAVTASNGAYLLWALLFAAAAWRPYRGASTPLRGGSELRLQIAVLGGVLAALALLVANEWVHIPSLSIVLAAVGLLAAIHRTAIALSVGLRQAREGARSRALLDDVRHAIHAEELTLHFQPLVDVRSGDPVGAEALLRWPRDGRMVPPDEYLPVVEDSPVMGPLTDYVLERALRELATWRSAGHRIGVSVNLAIANLGDDQLPERVAAALVRHGVPAQALTLELTETAAVVDDETTARVLAALDELGVQLSVDDFGTGHSSLVRLARFPIDELKIDRSFVMELESTERPIVGTAIELAHTLELRVVAEGVETAAALNALRGLGCDVAQGYFVARPMPASEFAAWLLARRDPEAAGEEAQQVLAELVAELGMEAAFIAELVDDLKHVRRFQGPATFGPLREGAALPRSESYCDRVVRGVFPKLIADARNDELTRGLATTEQSGLGAYVGVPLHAADGALYGTLCCVSHTARPELGEDDVRVLEQAVDRLRPLLEGAGLTIARRDPVG
jgi:EAL domain-containing protein (putative c-di-GMP-specific phosphodiesterase class I)